jgi:hypothetical protein
MCKTVLSLLNVTLWLWHSTDTPEPVIKYRNQTSWQKSTSRLPGLLQNCLLLRQRTSNNAAQDTGYVQKSKRTLSKVQGPTEVQNYHRFSIQCKAPSRANFTLLPITSMSNQFNGSSNKWRGWLKIHYWYVPPPPACIRSKCDLANHSSTARCCVEASQRGPPGSSCALIN